MPTKKTTIQNVTSEDYVENKTIKEVSRKELEDLVIETDSGARIYSNY